jgi:hypothetical protein
VTKSSKPRAPEWHLRLSRPDARTSTLTFIDAQADKMNFAQVLDALETNEGFRAFFIRGLANVDLRSYVWETPFVAPRDDFECALTELPLPTKSKLNLAKYAPHFETEESVVVVPEGDSTLILPCPRHFEGWYVDLATFVRRVPRAQAHELFQTMARTAKAATGQIWLRSSPPGAQWLYLRIDKSSKDYAYGRYVR